MWPLTKVGLKHFGLASRLGQQCEFAPRHHRHIADGFQSRMVPDRADVAMAGRTWSLAGRIDELALIDVVEVLRNALVQLLKNGLRAEHGRFVRRWILRQPPAEPFHSRAPGWNVGAKYELFARRRPARRDNVPERIKTFPCRFDGNDTRTWNINRGLGERHCGNIARAIWKDHVHFDADDHLRADRPGEQRIITIDPCAAVDAQSLRTAVHGNEQQPDMRVDREVAEALEHAIAVVIRKCKLGRSGDANETRRAAFE